MRRKGFGLPVVMILVTRAVNALASPDELREAPVLQATAPEAEHAAPAVALSYRQFSIGNLDGTMVPLEALQLDMYALSQRWVRWGIELEGGKGVTTLDAMPARLYYGMGGTTLGLQYPARVTPFLEARAVAGLIGGQVDGKVNVAGTSVSNPIGGTYLYGYGAEAGFDLYTVGRAYVSASFGWLRSTWHAYDLAAMMQDPQGALHFKDLTADTFTFKIGLGV